MRLLRYILILIILVIGITFSILNPGSLTLNYWIGSRTLPTPLFSVILFAMGFSVGLLLSAGLFLGARIEAWRLGRRLQVAEKEIRNLRVIPIQDRS